jgi:ferric-dicitrate binding protein FerR (iron transport regulator)
MPQEPMSPELKDALDDLPLEEARRLAETWHDLGGAGGTAHPAGAPSNEIAWVQLQARLDKNAGSRVDRPAVPLGRRLRMPAVILGVILLTAVVTVWRVDRPLAIVTGAGETQQVILVDGSHVTLAPESVLTVDRGLRATVFRARGGRNVAVHGEAFFEVETSERPFVVRTGNAVVEVVGTSFNVRFRPGEAESRTTVQVLSGSVRLRSSVHDDAVLLGASERSSVGPRGIEERGTTRADQIAVWRDGGFAIHHLPLADVLRELERRYDVTIRTGRDVPHEVPITLFYRRAADAETIIHDIALATDLQYRVLRGGFELVQPASQ